MATNIKQIIKEEYVEYMMNEHITTEGLWANINAKKKRGEKSAPKGSKAYKAAKKAGDKLEKTKEGIDEMKMTNKETGEDITRHVLAYMMKEISKEEFEKLAGLKPDKVKKSKVKVTESDAEYAKSIEKIARDKQLSMLSKKDKDTLLKIADLLKKANEGSIGMSDRQVSVLREKLVFYVDKNGKKRRFDTDKSANKKYRK